MRWAGHVVHMGEMRNAYTIFVGKADGKNLSEDLNVDLKWIFGKYGWWVWIGFIGSG
jgi:hypothetical protein